ncbi:MAG TPA: NADH-quinone oxidoreductase subunit NuoE [Candidatus Hydrogenedentes bacterium]|nr:NADH-quinone oxidoreductase subunit NuoE [Candidatus Hydrogenedentota bacterium]HRK33974.1 NADH-quinone oxidoreductase subunit NuoE [Candidatus Hydrogenedentota bacterium]
MLTEALKAEIESHIHEPEHRQSACTEALRIVQRERGWIDDESIKDIAEFLGMTTHELDSVATFFNLIHRRPVGRHVIRLCSSVSCWVLGYDALREAILTRLGISLGQTTGDGRFTVLPHQCLGTCDRAPALMIGMDLYQNVDPTKLDEILDRYA